MASVSSMKRGVTSLFGMKNAVLGSRIINCFSPRILYHKSQILFKSRGEEIKMPSLSPTMTEGTIVRWLKKEGDAFSPGDVLCDIQTDKAVVGFEVEEEGILAKILVPDDTKDVKIGTVIGVMVESGEDWKDVEVPSSVSPIATTQAPPQASGTVQGTAIKMPSLSPTMTEGTIVKWLKAEGDTISPGDVLCEIQTDKAIVGFETEEEGVLAKILVPENTKDVKLGTIIAVMVQEGEDWKNVSIDTSATPVSKGVTVDQAEKVSTSGVVEDRMSKKMCGPSVRNLLEEYGIKYSVVTPTGPHNILLKGDVLKYIAANNLHPQPVAKEKEVATVTAPDITYVEEQEFIDIPHTSMRKTIARRLTESKSTIPHAYMKIDCMMNDIIRLRSKMKNEGVAVSVNDFIIKCAALALQKVPEVNVVWDRGNSGIAGTIDISVAVATDTGLITPIVKNANVLAVQEISERVKELAGRARQGKLKPDEFQGGTFSISNLGMFGITDFTAVINPPQAAILAVGTSRLVPAGSNRLNTKMTVQLSYDRRVIDDSAAAKFLECFQQYIEDPLMIAFDATLKTSGKSS